MTAGFIKESGDVDVKEVLLLPQEETVVTYDGTQNY
jgi:hypothetical protein